jgi:phosphopantetheine adenylyltransferase
MTERRGSMRTARGIELKNNHQNTYENWWLGKHIETTHLKDYPNSEEMISGVVKNVKYIGNSVSGVVELTLDNGFVYLVSSRTSYRPTKTDVKII